MQGNPNNPYNNSEGYADPTPYRVFKSTAEDERYKSIAKKWLYQYLNLEKQIKMLSEEIEELESERDSITVKLDGLPRGTDLSDKTANLATRLSDMLMKRIEMRSEAWEVREEIVDYINGMANRTHSRILYLHFIQGATFEFIAVDINMSWRHTHRMYADALIQVGKDLSRK